VHASEARRIARAQWPIRKIALEEEGAIDPLDASTIDERVALVWQLTREAWSLQGREIPSYPRHEAPGLLVRRRGRSRIPLSTTSARSFRFSRRPE
jgi:hypothetical protein